MMRKKVAVGEQLASGPSAVLLNVEEVARALSCSPRHVRRLADAGTMPRPLKLGSLVRWRKADIEKWLGDGCLDLSKRRGAK
jgi:excisionase family DNA binding protein